MGMSLEDLYAVIEARQKAQRNYMFMETTVFQREFFYLQELFAQGKLGKLQYLSCAHYQDMEGWPSYWKGFPPLMHPTHALAPLSNVNRPLSGSGIWPRLRENSRGTAAAIPLPFAFESAFVSLENSDLTIEMERFLYGVARSYSECFRVYGEKVVLSGNS